MVTFVAVGILNGPINYLRPVFFVLVGLGAPAIAWCRISSDLRKTRIQRRVDTGLIGISDTRESVDAPVTQRAYFQIPVCLFSVIAPGVVPFVGGWLPALGIDQDHGLLLILGIVGLLLCACVVVAPQGHRVARAWSGMESGRALQESENDRPDEDALIANLTYSKLLEIYEESTKRTNLLGAWLLGQVACVGAGALQGASQIYTAAIFSAVVLSGVFLGLYRLSLSFADQDLRRKLSLGEMALSDSVKRAHFSIDVLVDSKALFFGIVVPPLTLFLGILDSIFHLPIAVSGFFLIYFLGLLLYALLRLFIQPRRLTS